MKLFDNRNWYGYNSKNWLLKKVSFFVMYDYGVKRPEPACACTREGNNLLTSPDTNIKVRCLFYNM